ncbi:MAG: TatD family hydrolase [Candidatus Bathyarchaeia archaeon]
MPGGRVIGSTYTDCHIHLSDPIYSTRLEEILEGAKASGLGAIVTNAVDLGTSLGNLRISEANPGFVYPAIGMHPLNISEGELSALKRLILASRDRLVAIGEVGLDVKAELLGGHRQLAILKSFLDLSKELDLPVIIHSRGMQEEAFKAVAEAGIERALFHWFTGSAELLRELIGSGYNISIGPSVLYSKRVRDVARETPIDLILTETDGPVPYRGIAEGGLTTPALIPKVALEIAELKGIPEWSLREAVKANFEKFFRVRVSTIGIG